MCWIVIISEPTYALVPSEWRPEKLIFRSLAAWIGILISFHTYSNMQFRLKESEANEVISNYQTRLEAARMAKVKFQLMAKLSRNWLNRRYNNLFSNFFSASASSRLNKKKCFRKGSLISIYFGRELRNSFGLWVIRGLNWPLEKGSEISSFRIRLNRKFILTKLNRFLIKFFSLSFL